MEELYNQLSSKNKDYMYSLHRQLMLNGKTDGEAREIIEPLLPEIIEKQKEGILARTFLGTPTAFASKYSTKVEKAKAQAEASKGNDNKYLMWLDSFLFLFGILALINGGVSVISNKPEQTYGIVTLLLMSMFAGVVMIVMYKNMYSTEKEGKWKRFGILALSMVAWVAIFILSALIPAEFNPQLSGTVTAILGAIALGIRYLLKKRYNIQSTMAPKPATAKKN